MGIHRKKAAAVLALVGVAGALTSLFLAPALRAARGMEINGVRVERATLLHMNYLVPFEPFAASPSGSSELSTSAPFDEDTLVIPALRIERLPQRTYDTLRDYSIEINATRATGGDGASKDPKSATPFVGLAALDFRMVEYNGATYVISRQDPLVVKAGDSVQFSAKLDYQRPGVPNDDVIHAQRVLLCRPLLEQAAKQQAGR